MNNALHCIRLYFNTPLHLQGAKSDYAESLTRIHSDTMYAALIQMWHLLGNENAIATASNSDLSWAISSLFPFTKEANGKDYVYFLPRPKKGFEEATVNSTFRDKKKKLKKIEWLDLDYFTEQVKNPRGASPKEVDIQFDLYLSKSKIHRFVESTLDNHANIPRDYGIGSKTLPYVTERIQYLPESGLYFLYLGGSSLLGEIEKALSLLQDEGIGSDRSNGNGRFTFTIEKLPKDGMFSKLFEGNSTYQTNLSLFLPESEEQLTQLLPNEGEYSPVAYDLKKRGGWITTEPYQTLQKKPVFMFDEGSIFKSIGQIAGKQIDVSPPTTFGLTSPVLRNGKSLFVPINV